ncbi:MAG TPA: urea transporter [Saprospiraceae bacterium]|nr:urea transporter [Saprospiraceae bacterium]MCC6689842.1 urea transporter [Saprospiraceae bacterium]HMV23323.1 urea transporter [Saprospiraceae bacterium]HMW74411.1 urea transporter [Saprospiraceae bacterium]HMX83072.1 urea transporter [Saprospiraceae bacterium]
MDITSNKTFTYKELYRFTNRVFLGLGQIILQKNAFAGLLILLAFLVSDITIGLAVLVATVVGTLIARLLNFRNAHTDNGLYGFNAALVGAAMFYFFQPNLLLWIWMPFFSGIATLVYHFFLTRDIPVYTLPFIVIIWVILRFTPVGLLSEQHDSISSAAIMDYYYIIRGFGQIVFQSEILSGLLIFLALVVGSRWAALYTLCACILSGFVALSLGIESDLTNNGLFAFNPILCAVVFAGPGLKNAVNVGIAVVLSMVLSAMMIKAGYVQLTFPFVASCWITGVLKR